jgi:hypothetical protein
MENVTNTTLTNKTSGRLKSVVPIDGYIDNSNNKLN